MPEVMPPALGGGGGFGGPAPGAGLTMLRLVSVIPACVAPPQLPMPRIVGAFEHADAHLTTSLLVSNMPACDAWPVLPLPRKVCAEAPARICSSENSRTFASAIFAPNVGPLYPGTFCAMRPSDCRLVRTCIMSLFSKSATVWNWSCLGTPRASQACR